jgi:beta-N-acetylglucosaminidase
MQPNGMGTVMKRIIVILSGMLLVGCVTAQERARQAEMAMDAKCQSGGAKFGTQEYIQCRTMAEQTAAMKRAAPAQEEQAAYANQQNWYGNR